MRRQFGCVGFLFYFSLPFWLCLFFLGSYVIYPSGNNKEYCVLTMLTWWKQDLYGIRETLYTDHYRSKFYSILKHVARNFYFDG